MQITQKNYVPNFGRAFTTEEKKEYKELIKTSRKALGLRDTSAIVFDFNVPSEEGFNLGIGSSYSESMLNLTDFMKTMIGINSVQLSPQGKISPVNTSPYSGTNFALGEHIIDLKQLTTPEYAEILSEDDIKNLNLEFQLFDVNDSGEYRTDYEYILGSDIKMGTQEKLLKKAYINFGFGVNIYDKDASRLDYEFKQFKEKNKDWLEPETLFSILTEEYGTDDFNNWDETDKNLYSESIPKEIRQKRIDSLKSDYKETIEYESFKQFLADKQQHISKKELNLKSIKVYGDCLLGFARSEIWSAKDCFTENLYYGGPDSLNCPDTNGIQTWGLTALDYTKLGEIGKNGDISKLGITGKLLYNKYCKFFERYDGLRMDAASQFVDPFIYKETTQGCEKVPMPEINDKILKILCKAGKDTLGRNFDSNNPNKVFLELIGEGAEKSKGLTKNIYPHLFTTSFAEYNETPEQFKKQGYHPNKFYIGVGNHDNDSLVNLSQNKEKRYVQMQGIYNDYNIDMSKPNYNCSEYKNQSDEEKNQEDFRIAKFAEIFTSAKQFFTLPDMFGMSQRINISGKVSPENWRVRIPNNYEDFYFSQLSKGYGLNPAKSYENAFYMKHLNRPDLTSKLAQAAEILRQDGPTNEEAANEADKKGKLKNKFSFKA